MTVRLNHAQAAPEAVRAMMGLEQYVRTSGLEPTLLHLVRLRASMRLYAVPVWRETPFFTPRERAALAWAESVTAIAATGVPDAAFEEVRERFTDAELVALTMAVVAINGWNRLAVSFRAEPVLRSAQDDRVTPSEARGEPRALSHA